MTYGAPRQTDYRELSVVIAIEAGSQMASILPFRQIKITNDHTTDSIAHIASSPNLSLNFLVY